MYYSLSMKNKKEARKAAKGRATMFLCIEYLQYKAKVL